MVTGFTLIFFFCFLIQIGFWCFCFASLLNWTSKSNTAHGVSLLICTKDDVQMFQQNIVRILNQSFNKYEIQILDNSEKEEIEKISDDLVRKGYRQLLYNKVRTISVGKKQAIIQGLAAARQKWLLLTDIDCFPASSHWISSMVGQITNKTKLVLGYSPVVRLNSLGLLGLWSHFESWITAVQYLSFANMGLPYMGVGRNLLIEKSAFDPEILEKNIDLVSGDDDLTVNAIAHSNNCSINIDSRSFVYTYPKHSWSAYFNQKRRHFSTAHRYKLKHIVLLSLYGFSQILFVILGAVLIFINPFIIITLFILRYLLVLPIVKRLVFKLEAQFNMKDFILMDALQSVFYLIFSFTVLFPQKRKW